MFRLNLVLFAVLLACALGVVTAQHQARQKFVHLQDEQSRAKRLDEEWGRLQLEQSTWAMHSRIEQIATRHLQMRVPATDRVQMVAPGERVSHVGGPTRAASAVVGGAQ